MSLGRKKETKVKIDAPPPITRTVYTNPLGDQFTSTSYKGTETHSSQLSPGTQSVVDESLSGLQSLARELNAPDAQRLQAINDRSRDYYDLQASGINQDVDATLARTRSDLNKRFGGAYNATFGASLLSDVESGRLGRLSDARKEAALTGEDLYRQDEDSRMQRFTLFQNYLNDLNNQARGLQTSNASVLSNERQRASAVATDRANLAVRAASEDRQTREANERQARQDMARIAAQVAQVFV